MATVRSTEEVLQLLRDALPELRQRYPIARIGIFGSYARGEQTPESDVDVLVELGQAPALDYFGLWEDLVRLFGRRVDLVEPESVKLYWRKYILNHVIFLQ